MKATTTNRRPSGRLIAAGFVLLAGLLVLASPTQVGAISRGATESVIIKALIKFGLLDTGLNPIPDANAYHDNVAGEIAATALKATPVGADFLVIEDSAGGNAKARILISSLPSSGGAETLDETLTLGNTAAQAIELAPGGSITSSDQTGTASPLNIVAGASTSSGVGGLVNIDAGAGSSAGGGGAVLIDAGAGGPTGPGGPVDITAGAGGGASTPGGSITIEGGEGGSGGASDGGLVQLVGGNAQGTGSGGSVELTGGDSAAAGGTAGDATVRAGDAGAASGDAGGVAVLQSGNGDGAGADGEVRLRVGNTTQLLINAAGMVDIDRSLDVGSSGSANDEGDLMAQTGASFFRFDASAGTLTMQSPVAGFLTHSYRNADAGTLAVCRGRWLNDNNTGVALGVTGTGFTPSGPFETDSAFLGSDSGTVNFNFFAESGDLKFRTGGSTLVRMNIAADGSVRWHSGAELGAPASSATQKWIFTNTTGENGMGLFSYGTSTSGATLVMAKGRGTPAAPTTYLDDDAIGTISFFGQIAGVAGDGHAVLATIGCEADGVPSSVGPDSPGRLVFSTTPAGGSGLPVTRLTILEDGNIVIGIEATTTEIRGAPATTVATVGAEIVFLGGLGTTTARGGQSSVQGGMGGPTDAQGGDALIQGGSGGGTNGAGGDVDVFGGLGSGTGNGGLTTVRGGDAAGSGTDGAVVIGTSTTSTVTIGATATPVVLAGIPSFPTFTVATLPSAATAGQMIFVSDETGGAVMAFSDGTNWLRVTDRAIVA